MSRCTVGPGRNPCGNARPGPYDLGQCRLCWKAIPGNTPGPVARTPLPARRVRCAHLGKKVRPGCDCQERVCGKGHGGGRGVRMLVECQGCPDYRPPDPPGSPPAR